MMEFFTVIPEWLGLLFRGLLLGAMMAAAAVAASRAGRTPYWGLCAIVPYLAIVVIWAFAFCEWPLEKKDDKKA